MPYFNTDYLDDVDLPENYQLDEFGQPMDAPDIEALMQDYLSQGSFYNVIAGTGIEYEHDDVPFDMEGEYRITDPAGAYKMVSGRHLWNMSGGPELLAALDPYNQWKEQSRKRGTITNIDRSLNTIKAMQHEGLKRTKEMQTASGKAGFAGSGNIDKMQKAHYGDITRSVQGGLGNINKAVLGYEGDVHSERKRHTEDIWSVYSDWLSTRPEKGLRQTGSIIDSAGEIIDETTEEITDYWDELNACWDTCADIENQWDKLACQAACV